MPPQIAAESVVPGPVSGASRRVLLAAGLVAGFGLRPGSAGSAGNIADSPEHGTVVTPAPIPVAGPCGPLARREWEHFKSRFVMADGRVADNANGGISHSEGQGFTMLLAVRFDEPDLFDRCLRWTRGVLARREDMLLSWRYRQGDVNPVSDRNNATDGDLLIAWALAEAAGKWNIREYHQLAAAMGRDILRHLVVEASERATLLPGIHGFRQNDVIIANPSYYIFPAFQALRQVLPSSQWSALEAGGLRLMRHARFGRWGLVPDWVAMPRGVGRPMLAPGRPSRFSYDALRVPLYMVWAGFGAEPAVSAAAQFWHDPTHRRMPAWVDLRTDQTAPYAADPGIAAVATLSARGASGQIARLDTHPPVLAEAYYATALRLLARMADMDRQAGSAAA